MTIGLIGKKMGMSQRFFENGEVAPVTILKIEKAKVVEIINKEKRGYSGILVGYGHIKNSKLTKQMKGFFSKKSQEPKKILKEFRIENQDQYKPGTEINLNILKTLHESGFFLSSRPLLSVTIVIICFFSDFSSAKISIVLSYVLLIFLPSVPGIVCTFLSILLSGIINVSP